MGAVWITAVRRCFPAYPNRCNQLDFVTVLQRAGTWGSYEDVLAGQPEH